MKPPKKSSKDEKSIRFADALIDIFAPDSPKHSEDEIRWRAFLRNLNHALAHDQEAKLLGLAGQWKTPTTLTGNDITMFELLQYPNMKSTDPEVCKLRDLGRQLYQAVNDPETFNQEPESMRSLIAWMKDRLPHLHRLVLGHPNIRSNSATGRWEHRTERYRGTFSQNSFTVNNKKGTTIFQMEVSKYHEISLKFDDEGMVEFAQALGLI